MNIVISGNWKGSTKYLSYTINNSYTYQLAGFVMCTNLMCLTHCKPYRPCLLQSLSTKLCLFAFLCQIIL